jgi:hypothetical protein
MHLVSQSWSREVDNVERVVQMEVLKGWGREVQLRRKWNKLWAEIGQRILRLPRREQDILLEDFRTAIQSRILVMERVNNANRDH